MTKTTAQLVAEVRAELREQFNVGISYIPVARLREAIAYAKTHDGIVDIKIPSHSEFSMSLPQAEAVLLALTVNRELL